MATTTILTAAASASLSWTFTGTDGAGNIIPDNNGDALALPLAAGTGTSAVADLKYTVLTTLAGAGFVELNLADGSLRDTFGNALVFARVKQLLVRVLGTTDNPANTGGPVDVGGATNPLPLFSPPTSKGHVGGTAGRRAAQLWLCEDAIAYAVNPGVADSLRLTNVDPTNPVQVRISLIGSTT